MKALFLTFSILFFSFYATCAWININSGINDDLTSISFAGTTGLITGKKGVYISTNGGITSGSWVLAQNYFTPADSVSYNHSQFYGSVPCYFFSTQRIFFCGSDTVLNVSVIFEYNTATNKLKKLYSGTNTRFNDIGQRGNLIYAVGDNGQIVLFDEINPVFSTVTSNFSYNLQSVSFYGTAIVMTSGDLIIKGSINNSSPNTGTFSQYNYPNRNFKDAVFDNSMYSIYGTGKNLFRDNNLVVTEPHQYYSDSLKGNAVLSNSNRIFIGTETGIYRSPVNSNILEFQPSSSGFRIYGIQSNGTNLFACGKNGVILYSSDLGGDPEPYAQIDYNGGCINTIQSVTSTKGTVTSCSNYLNNTFINSNCSGFTYTFNTAGTHEIKLTVSNASYSKTVIRNITIVAIPQINLLTDVADTILCKQEVLDITLPNTENNVYYSLFKSGSSTNYGNSPTGNGGSLNFQSNTLNQAGTYYLRATSSLANCYKNFTDLITIQVEKPVSKIYYDIINAEVNEDVRFYQRSAQASNFEWHFSNSPALSTSNLPDPINSFTGIGSSQVTLISGTVNNCFDSTTVRGPFIYQPYVTDTTWLLLNSRTAPTTNNTIIGEDIIKTIKSGTGGYVVIGNYLHRQLNSRVGDSVNLPGLGQYLAKYNDFGILKWCIETKPINQSAFGFDIITDVMEDSNGNLFITGNTNSMGLIDNKGDTILPYCSFLLKTDSLGRKIWTRSMALNQGSFLHVNHDYNDDIYLTVGFQDNSTSNPTTPLPFYFNGVPTDDILLTEDTCQVCNDVYKIVKLNNNGQKLYDFMFEVSSANPYVTPKVVFDSSNNLYLWGSKEIGGIIHEPASGDTIALFYTPGNYGGKSFICKFDVNGNYIWKIQTYTQDALNDNTQIYSLITDNAGNLYATGRNDYDSYMPSSPHIIVNADNSNTIFYGGKYFLTKINSSGMTQWITGNNSSYYGMGLDLLLDNDTLYAVGMARTNNNTNLDHEFLGENNLSVSVNSNTCNYFVNKYTTDGEILGVYLNAPTNAYTGIFMDIDSYPNLIKLDDGYFLLNKSISVYSSAPDPAYDFGFTLLDTDFPQDGTQLKIKLNQGIEFLPHYLTQFYDTTCYGSSYTFPDGTQIANLTSTMLHTDSLFAANGIDSIIRYHVFVTDPTIHYQTVDVCFGEDYEIANDTTFTNIESGFVYDQLVVSPNSCDSIIRREFFVHPVTYSIAVATVCEGEDLVLGNGVIAAHNMQHDSVVEIVLQSIYGCDSTVNINVHVSQVNELVTQNGNQLNGEDPWASYQWVNCNNNYSAIPGQTAISFTAVVNGSYAAIVTRDGCTDTSACFTLTGLSINELGYAVSVYPNPTNNKSVIDFGQAIGSANISVYSNDGRSVLETQITGTEKYELDLTPFEKGTYFVRIMAEDNSSLEFILVKN